MSKDVFGRLCVSIRDEATVPVGAAEHGLGVCSDAVVYVPAAGAGLRRPLLADLQQQQQLISSVQTQPTAQ